MRLTNITFKGFKRLADTACNVDGRLIAFLGPNEAGKSSVLEGLAWLSERGSGFLPVYLQSRASGALDPKQQVIQARFALDEADRTALAHLDSDDVPRYFNYIKCVDGSYQSGLEPSMTRRRGALDAALAGLREVEARYDTLRTVGTEPAAWRDTIIEALGDGGTSPDEEVLDAFTRMDAWLRQASEPRQPKAESEADEPEDEVPEPVPEDVAVAELLAAALAKLQEPWPSDAARALLARRMPTFVLFGEADRVLESTYDLASPPLRANPPRALVNLLTLAETDVETLFAMQQSGDGTRLRTGLKKANARLRERVQPTWKQAQLAVHLNINGSLLEIFVDELTPGGDQTVISERSDGLREFIALVCFLQIRESGVPPVLMIDEAETHLHYDAQADLIDLLLNHVKTSKVIYTTHSPGCLPPDLGTGIRLVAPDAARAGASVLRSDFWSSDEPGFNPLLFAMGAGAAAFSVCRRAVLAEGASDMILLPSLIRAATGATELGYQVAPGLGSAFAGLGDHAIAAQVAYLADGDKAGKDYQKHLLGAGVQPDRVLTLPDGQAIEDLITLDSYLAAVNALMHDSGYTGKPVVAANLTGTGPVAKRLKDWAQRNANNIPSHNAVASYLVQDPARIQLTPDGVAALRKLDSQFKTVLKVNLSDGHDVKE